MFSSQNRIVARWSDSRLDTRRHPIRLKKHRDASNGAIQWKIYADYKDSLDLFDEVVTVNRPVNSLRPEHFQKVRTYISDKYSFDRTNLYIQSIKGAFAWAERQGYADVPSFGDEFKKPSTAERQQERLNKVSNDGDRMFTADELNIIIPRLASNADSRYYFGVKHP